MEMTIYVLTSTLVLLGVFLAYQTYLVRKKASLKNHEIGWVLEQLDRAVGQLESANEEVVVAGLQAIAVLNDDETRRRALRKVSDLTQSPNPRIARAALFTLNRLSVSSEKVHHAVKNKSMNSIKC
jgi:cob(I)alamin adenosyltransferase